MASISSHSLTTAQLEVFDLLRSGLGQKEVAHHLGLSESAVKARLNTAKKRLGARTTIHAVAMAYDMGLLTRDMRDHTQSDKKESSAMKRDMELVRAILMDIEEFEGPNGFMTYEDFFYDDIADAEKRRIRHHLDIMSEAGLISVGGPDGPSSDALNKTMTSVRQLRDQLAGVALKGASECSAVVRDAHEAYRRDIHPHLQRDFQEGYEQIRYFHERTEAFFTELGQGLRQMGRDFGAVGSVFVDATKQLVADAVAGLERAAARASSDKAVHGLSWSGYDLLDKVRDPADWERVKDSSVETLMEAGKSRPAPAEHRVLSHQP